MVAERERIAPYLDAEPDKTLALVVEMDFDAACGMPAPGNRYWTSSTRRRRSHSAVLGGAQCGAELVQLSSRQRRNDERENGALLMADMRLQPPPQHLHLLKGGFPRRR
jgi:hypothetical protein